MVAVLQDWNENLRREGMTGYERTPLRLETVDFVAYPLVYDWLLQRAPDPAFWARLVDLGVGSVNDVVLCVLWPAVLLAGSVQWAVIAAAAALFCSYARQAFQGRGVQ